MCGYHSPGFGGVLLELKEDIPDWDHFLHRWTSEKLMGILLDVKLFIYNQKNYPVLSKAHQFAVKEFMKQNPKFILRGKHPNDDLD